MHIRFALGSTSAPTPSQNGLGQFITQTGETILSTVGSTLNSALNLGIVTDTVNALWSYTGSSSLASASTSNYYQIQTSSTTDSVLLISVSSYNTNGMNLQAIVYNSAGKALSTRVLRNDGQNYIIELTGVKANTNYYVRIYAAAGSGTNRNYTWR